MKSSILSCVITILAILELTACGQASSPSAQDKRVPQVIPTAVSSITLPDSAPTGASYLPTLAPYTPAPRLAFPTSTADVLQPRSTRVELGKPYPFTLYTHCEIDFETDFDDSFWDAGDTANGPLSLGNPAQVGTMILIDNNHARFDWEGGSLNFIRHVGPKVSPGLCR